MYDPHALGPGRHQENPQSHRVLSNSAGCYSTVSNQAKYEACFGRADDDRIQSVEPWMPCEVCQKPLDDAVMLVCESCNKGFHTCCLCPRLYDISKEAWFCGDCGGPSQCTSKITDTTEDANTLLYLRKSTVAPTWTSLKKKRTKKGALNYFMSEDNNCSKPG